MPARKIRHHNTGFRSHRELRPQRSVLEPFEPSKHKGRHGSQTHRGPAKPVKALKDPFKLHLEPLEVPAAPETTRQTSKDQPEIDTDPFFYYNRDS